MSKGFNKIISETEVTLSKMLKEFMEGKIELNDVVINNDKHDARELEIYNELQEDLSRVIGKIESTKKALNYVRKTKERCEKLIGEEA